MITSQKINLFAFVTILFSLLFPKEAISASPTLTSAHIYDGGLDGIGFTWTTNSYGSYLFLAPNAPDAALINDSAGHVSYSLLTGQNKFYFFGEWGRGGTPKSPPWGLILGFNGAGSGFDIFATQNGISASTTEGAAAYDSQPFGENWINSFSYTVDGYNIQLTDYNIFVGDVTGQDRVSPFAPVSSGIDDAVGSFTLTVTPVPEPEIYAMLGLGIGILSFANRRKRASV